MPILAKTGLFTRISPIYTNSSKKQQEKHIVCPKKAAESNRGTRRIRGKLIRPPSLSAYFAYSAVASSFHSLRGVPAPFRHDPLELHFWIVAEVYQQAQFESSGSKVILHLRSMLVREIGHRFQFENNLVVANEVGLVRRA